MIRKHKKAAKIITTALVLVVMLGTFFVQSVFASNEFIEAPVYESTSAPTYQWLHDNGYAVNADNAYKYYAVYNATGAHVFYTWVYENNYWYLYFMSDINVKMSFGWGTQYVNSGNNFTHNYDIYYYQVQHTSQPVGVVADFTSTADAVAAFKTFAENDFTYETEPVSFDSTINVKPGYVAYVLTEGGSVTLSAYQYDLSGFSSPFWLTRSHIAFGVNRPTQSYVLDYTFGDLISWQKDTSYKPNILGQTHYSIATYEDLPSDGTFVAIYNPLYSSFSTNQDEDYVSPIITAHFTNAGAVVQYPIRSSFNGNDIESTSTSLYNEYYLALVETNGAITDEDYIYTSDGGNTTSSAIMSDYGDNAPPTSSVHSIGDLVQKVIDLLSAPIEHISNLYQAAAGFFMTLTSLWSWLPPEITTILISAMIVLVVVGVVKFLWK